MKKIASILMLPLFFLLISACCVAQNENKKQCQPEEIVFKNFQKNSLNILAGVAGTRIRSDGKNYFGYGVSAGINYFPVKYFEVGYRFNPTYISYDIAGKKLLAENTVYVKYYYLRIPCRKVIFSFCGGILKDGSLYNTKGETINKEKIYFYLSPADINILLGKWGQFISESKFFLNDRPLKFSFALMLNIKNIKL